MRRMLRYQLSYMVRSREYIVALLLSTLVVSISFVIETIINSKLDRAAILAASEVYCGYGLSLGWRMFSAVWPFLVVLPFATSFVADKKNQCIAAAVSRSSYSAYFRSKVIVSGIGSASVVCIPMIANLLLCYTVFPHNNNLVYTPYHGIAYATMLMGENRMFPSFGGSYFLVSMYLNNPLLHQVVYLIILTAFSALCGSTITAISFRFSKVKMVLFIPLYAVVILSLSISSTYLDAAIYRGVRYFETYILDYLAPMTSADCVYIYFAFICAGFIGLCTYMLRWADKHTLEVLQG